MFEDYLKLENKSRIYSYHAVVIRELNRTLSRFSSSLSETKRSALRGNKRELPWKSRQGGARLDMETKSQPNRKIRKRRKVLHAGEPARSGSARKPVSRLIASAKLPERKLRKLIRCYAERMPPKEAIIACGLSHVTVRRIYRQIRERLIVVGLYQPSIVPGAPAWWQEQERPRLVAMMREAVRPQRGVRDENIDPYFAEAIYRRETQIPPGQLYRLILKATDDLGPLNRPPDLACPVSHIAERYRLLIATMKAQVRASDDPQESKSLGHRLLDDFAQRDLLGPSRRAKNDKQAHLQ